MNRRGFLTSALKATAAGILVPEWILDPPKGRSMVSVPSDFDVYSMRMKIEGPVTNGFGKPGNWAWQHPDGSWIALAVS